jgi:hypothetical protein
MRRRTIAVGGAVFAALTIVVLAVMAFPSAPEARATAKPIELPQDLEPVVFLACLPGLYPGSGAAGSTAEGVSAEQGFVFSSHGSAGTFSVRIEATGDWSVSVTRSGAIMRSERSSDNPARISAIAAAVIPTARSLYHCMAPYHFAAHPADPPRSGAQLLQLYRYDREVLWPCLTSHGIDVGDPPTRDQFASSFLASTADPLKAMTVTKKTLPRLVPALQACPIRPAYLG